VNRLGAAAVPAKLRELIVVGLDIQPTHLYSMVPDCTWARLSRTEPRSQRSGQTLVSYVI
jgi:hypothetical protein